MNEAATGGGCAVLIPAFDEERRVAAVIEVALAADRGPVLVVDDGSSDATAQMAREAGAHVHRLEVNVGKGAALFAGARQLDAEVVVLLDADLVGLTPEHVRMLADPVLDGSCDMTRGVFAGARLATSVAQRLAPALGGQRGLRREALASVDGIEQARFGIEILLESAARRGSWRTCDVNLRGVGQVMKEEKRGWRAGVRARLAMYSDIVRAMLRRS